MIARAFKTDAIVIRRVSFSETDRIVTLLTPNFGKLRCIAKGIKRIHSRKAAHLELFNQISAYIVNAKTFGIITEALQIESFHKLRENLVSIAYAYKAAEQVDRLCVEGVENQTVYSSLLNLYSRLDEGQVEKFPFFSEQFTRELLWELGYLPKSSILSGSNLQRFLVQIMEKVPKSEGFLTSVTHKSTIRISFEPKGIGEH